MTIEELKKLFEIHNDEYIRFERVKNKLSSRPDLHAFLLLDSMCPGSDDMVSSARDDEIYLGVDPHSVLDAVTESMVVDLIRCGISYNREFDCFVIFV